MKLRKMVKGAIKFGLRDLADLLDQGKSFDAKFNVRFICSIL